MISRVRSLIRTSVFSVVDIRRSQGLGWHDLQIDRGEHNIDQEQQHERNNNGLVHRIADTFRPSRRIQSTEGSDDSGHEAVNERFDFPDPEIRKLGERIETRQISAWSPSLQDDIE